MVWARLWDTEGDADELGAPYGQDASGSGARQAGRGMRTSAGSAGRRMIC
jgi:hypothetical protein